MVQFCAPQPWEGKPKTAGSVKLLQIVYLRPAKSPVAKTAQPFDTFWPRENSRDNVGISLPLLGGCPLSGQRNRNAQQCSRSPMFNRSSGLKQRMHSTS